MHPFSTDLQGFIFEKSKTFQDELGGVGLFVALTFLDVEEPAFAGHFS